MLERAFKLPLLAIFLFGSLAFAEVDETIEFTEVFDTYTAPSGRAYTLPNPPPDAVDRVGFELMSPEMQEAFLKKRANRLKRRIRSRDRFLTPRAFASATVRNIFAADRSDLVTVADMRKLRQQRLQAHIDAYDAYLWKNPEVVANANEVGLTPRVGVYTGAMVGKLGLFWSSGLGLNAGVDPKRGISLELYQDIDRATAVYPGTASLGVYGSLLGSLAHRDPKKPLDIEHGSTLCTIGGTACLTDRTSRVGWTYGVGPSLPIPNAYVEETWHVPLARVALAYRWPFVQFKLLNPVKFAELYGKVLWPKFKADVKGLGPACRRAFGRIGGESAPSQDL